MQRAKAGSILRRFYPMEALRTNVLGTENVMTAAAESRCNGSFSLVRTRLFTQSQRNGDFESHGRKSGCGEISYDEWWPRPCATRYGNVMASRVVPVIPLFVSQIKAGLPLTVTDPHMTRFLMSLEDSVDLVIHAYEHGAQGDIFVQKGASFYVGSLGNRFERDFQCK